MTVISHRLGLVFLVCVVMFGACSTSTADRGACYARAEERAAKRANTECPLGDSGPDAAAWTECKARVAIMDELNAAYRRCP